MKKYFLITTLLLSSWLPTFAQDKAAAPEKKDWSHSTGAGLVITAGNTETTTASASHDSIWEKGKNKFALNLNGAYGTKKEVDTTGKKKNKEFVNNINERAQFNRNFSDSFYWFIAQSAEEDNIARLQYRLTAGPGLGYNAIKKDPYKLDLELGAVYIVEKYKKVDSEDNISGRVAEKFNWKISNTANLWLNTEVLINFDDAKDFRVNSELGIDVKINDRWLVRSSVQDKYYHAAPSPLKKNDVIFITSVVFKY